MKRKRLPAPINVRLPADLKKRLEKIADDLNLTTSDILRLSVTNQLPNFENRDSTGTCVKRAMNSPVAR